MNYEKALKTIERILKDEVNEKICILIDGQWGIGKTYTINKFIEENNEFDLKYVSVFGKESLREIEKNIVTQMLPMTNVKKKLENNNSLKIFGSVVGDILKQYSGIDGDFTRSISIENISSDDKVIICIDDLERKSENIKLKDILGLVERATSNFNIILIGSLNNLNEEEMKEFNSFKEKIIDHELIVNELSDTILKDIAKGKLKDIDNNILNEIVGAFKGSELDEKNKLNNLRIYKKYINLLYKIDCEIRRVLGINDNKIDEKIISISMSVIYENYIHMENSKKRRKRSFNYTEEQLRNVIEKIFRYEEYDESNLKEYLEIHSQIQKDIRSLYQVYKLSKEEALEIVHRIENNINLKNKEYFIKQKYIIGLYDALTDIGIIDSFKSRLNEMAEYLYEPKIDEKPEQFKIDDYNIYDQIEGESQNYKLYPIITYINKYNIEKYDRLKESILQEKIKEKDIIGIEDILRYFHSISFDTFKIVYDLAFNILDKQYNEIAWKVIGNIIYKTDTNLVRGFLEKEIADKKNNSKIGIITNSKLKRVYDILDEKEYFEWQMQQRRESYEEEMN